MSRDIFTTYMKNQIDNINLHLPKRVMTLKQILLLKEPEVILRDGTKHRFDSEELDYIKSILHESEYNRVQLPIIITRRRELGANAYVAGGDIGNLYVILKILGEDIPPFNIWKLTHKQDFTFYRLQLMRVRRKVPTLTVVAFS